MHKVYWWESPKERDHWEDQEIGGWVILKWILGRGDMNWIDLSQDRGQWRALTNMVMDFEVP
jgi:hypothetical protein